MTPAKEVVGDAAGIRGSQFARNLVHFARLLRRAGLPVGPGSVVQASRAVGLVGPGRRDDLYWALASTLVRRRSDQEVFDRAFSSFWRDPAHVFDPARILPSSRLATRREPRPGTRRLSEAWTPPGASDPDRPPRPRRTDVEGFRAYSPGEVRRTRDFEQMSAEELGRALAEIRRLTFGSRPIPTRRWRPAETGSVPDPRRTLRATFRAGAEPIQIRRRRRGTRLPRVAALVDVSGSMDPYARVLLHFLHALTRARGSVETFLFATRLHRVTRSLRHRDADRALAQVGENVTDWSGGTRIGQALRTFNREWSRRVLGAGSIVLLVSDGLDRDDGDVLAREAERLRKSCDRLVWLNPLLRYARFEPRARGVRTLLPWVHEHRPVHDLASLEAVARALEGPSGLR